MSPPPEKLKKKHRLTSYFDQLEVFKIKLFLKKHNQLNSISQFIRKAIFEFMEENMEKQILEKLQYIENNIGKNIQKTEDKSRKELLKEKYKRIKEQARTEESKSKSENLEKNRAEVLDEIKKLFARGEEILSKAPQKEIDRIKKDREKRIEIKKKNGKS